MKTIAEDLQSLIIKDLCNVELRVKEQLRAQTEANNRLIGDMQRMSSRNAMLIQELAKTHAALADAQDDLGHAREELIKLQQERYA